MHQIKDVGLTSHEAKIGEHTATEGHPAIEGTRHDDHLVWVVALSCEDIIVTELCCI